MHVSANSISLRRRVWRPLAVASRAAVMGLAASIIAAPILAAGPQPMLEHTLRLDPGATQDAAAGRVPADGGPQARGSDLVQQAHRAEETDRTQLGFAKAYALYCEAARLDHTDALMRLGWMHAEGRGVLRDDAIADTLFRRAAGVVGHGDKLPACLRPPPQTVAAPIPIAPSQIDDESTPLVIEVTTIHAAPTTTDRR